MALTGTLGTLVYVLLGLCLIALVWWVIGYLDLPPQVQKIATVVVVIIVVIWLFRTVFPGTI